jgi:hypothetical protein
MTDGPYAPPSMNRQWNDAARSFRLSAFEEESPARFRAALSADARREQVAEAVAFMKERLAEQEAGLFGASFQDTLNAARQRFQTPMALSVIDHCEQARRRGVDPQQAIQDGVAGALRERGRDRCNSIEHHTMQEAGVRASQEVQRRCESTLRQENWNELAAEVMSEDRPASGNVIVGEDDRTEVGPPIP